MLVLALPFIAIGFVSLVLWFVALEQRGDRHRIFVTLVVVLVVESVLAGHSAQVPPGLLRPTFGSQDFRPPDVVIVCALAARVLSTRLSSKAALPTLIWSGFFAWYLAGIGAGLASNLATATVLYQGKLLMYVAGGMIVGSGADLAKVARDIRRLTVPLAAFTLLSGALTVAKVDLPINTPVQDFNNFGRLGNDSITLLLLVGIISLIVEATAERRSSKVVIASLILVLAPLTGQQRASYLVLAACVSVLGLVAFGTTWRRRTNTTVTEMVLVGAGLMAVAVGGIVAVSSARLITARIDSAFGGAAEERSAEARFTLVRLATDRIRERPVTGWGVGVQVSTETALSGRQVEAAAHNVVLDIWMRTGIVGVVLIAAAVVATLLLAFRRWRTERDPQRAAVVLGAAVVIIGIFSKAMVETALDKFRLSTALGIALGMVVAGWHGTSELTDDRERRVSLPSTSGST